MEISQHNQYMKLALDLARSASRKGEVPIGAVIVSAGKIIAAAHNTCESKKDPLAHAELAAIRQAARLKNNWRLTDCDLYVTLEPCPMCLGALFQARIKNLIFGCPDPKRQDSPFFPSLNGHQTITDNNHGIRVYSGILAEQCSEVLKTFFKERRRGQTRPSGPPRAEHDRPSSQRAQHAIVPR